MEQAIRWGSAIDDYAMCIGGGEPTNHPRFFDILRQALIYYEDVHMVTNGSNTKAMFRLADIISGEPEFFEDEEIQDNAIWDGDHKLHVALSQDQYHDPIDPRIVELWRSRSVRERRKWYMPGTTTERADSGFLINELHRVTNHGRARRTGVSTEYKESCLCQGVFVKPDGKVKACGCPGGPIIGDVFTPGFTQEYYNMLDKSDGEQNCYKWYKMTEEQRKEY